MFEIYRVTTKGETYVSRTVTTCEKLAKEICRDWNNGVTVMPWGETVPLKRKGFFIVKPI